MSRGATMYDRKGKIRATGKDICDCFDENCPGCHFDCERCGSPKCCIECRQLRTWCYQDIELERNGGVIFKKNPLCQKTAKNKKK